MVYKGKTYNLSTRLRPPLDNLVVFLHGWGGAKECFDGAFSYDALEGYGMCAIDLLGFGKSDQPAGFSYDLLDQANIAALAVNSFKAKKVYLVGHSMGGGIGTLAAPLITNLAIFIDADSNLAPSGSGTGARLLSKQPFWLFKFFTLPLIKILLWLHPKRPMRVWAKWFSEASPLGLHRSIQSLVEWSDGGELLPRFRALRQKAYIYGEKGKRRKDVVPELDKSIVYEVPKSGHALMNDNPAAFYDVIAKIIGTT